MEGFEIWFGDLNKKKLPFNSALDNLRDIPCIFFRILQRLSAFLIFSSNKYAKNVVAAAEFKELFMGSGRLSKIFRYLSLENFFLNSPSMQSL